jgi:hypothetical protein
MELNLFPLKGFNTLLFGCTPKEFTAVYGEPSEIEELKDEVFNDHATVYHYWDLGFSAFFTKKPNETFSSIEIDNKGALMFDKKIFELNEKQVIALFKEQTYKLSESEMHEWGEKRLSFDDAGVDLYFANNKLASINYGSITDVAGPFYYFPN